MKTFALCVMLMPLLCAAGCAERFEDRRDETQLSSVAARSPYVRRTLEALQRQELKALVSKLPSHPGQAFSLEPRHVLVQLSAPSGYDLPRFFVVIDAESERFWILQTGDFTGQTRWWGPAVISAEGDPVPLGNK